MRKASYFTFFAVSGFTLLEMAVVLAIIGLIAAGSMVTFTSYIQASQYNATVSGMDTIEHALKDYSVAFGRIPCPSSLTTLASDTNGYYGAEAANAGTCTGGTPAANFWANHVAEGGIPTRALKLPDSYMYDAWGRRLRYAVAIDATGSNAVPTTIPESCGITVFDATGAPRSLDAIYAIISHGANGHGAFTSNGVAVNAGSNNANEQVNCHCDNTGISTGYPDSSDPTPSYVEMLPSVSSADITDTFDDIVTFKESWQLIAPQSIIASSSPPTIYFTTDWNVRKFTVGGNITTVAGTGTAGYSPPGDGGLATSAKLNDPQGVAVDSSGNVYVADRGNNRIRKITASTGIITTVAGNGTAGYSPPGDGGLATSAKLNQPAGVALDSSGNLYIADLGNNRIREVTASTGFISTYAGNGTAGYSPPGDGGLATSAKLKNPIGLTLDSSGNLYIADFNNNRIRKVTASTGIITTVAGNGTAGYSPPGDGGLATSAELNSPAGVAVDSSGNLYIGDYNNNRVRKVAASTGIITTVAGNGTAGTNVINCILATSDIAWNPWGVAVDSSGNLYFANNSNDVINEVRASTGIMTTIAGVPWGYGFTGFTGDGVPATQAQIGMPMGVAVYGR